MAKSLKVLMLTIAFTFTSLFAQSGMGQYQTRSLLEKKIFYVYNNKIVSAKYWSIPLGLYPVKLTKRFPGEGMVAFEAEINFALLSSGYIEGTGYGERGKATASANFAVSEGDTLRLVEFSEIDYVYLDGKKIKLKKSSISEQLFIKCEKNELNVKKMGIMLWNFNEQFKELKHSKDVDRVVAFAFTKEAALRALKAQKAEASN